MDIARLAIEKKTITLVLTLLILGGGILSFESLGRLEDPEFTIKEAQVFTLYPGATAREVEEEVTDRLETAIQTMGQLKRVWSISEAGKSTIRVVVKDHYDIKTLPQVWDELRRKVNDIQGQLPPGASSSIVYDEFGDVFGIFASVYGDGYSFAELKEHAKYLRRELLLVQDVGKIDLFGDQKETIYVEISRSKLSQLGISPDLIYQTLSQQNLVTPSGEVEVGNLFIRIQPTGEIQSVKDIGDLLLLQDNASRTKLYLKDVASITRGYEDPPNRIMHYNGSPSIGLGISTIKGGNVVKMGQALKKRAAELQKETPIGMEFGPIWFQPEMVSTAIQSFMISLLEALVIVIGVLIFAMGFRSAILIGGILLLTIFSTFIFMDINGVLLERISLGALIIALGMLVDNAIVVIEGIMVNIQKGMDKVEAASGIVKQTIWPLFGATVVAILAFAAIGVSQDKTGEFCRSLFQVILYSLGMSWVLAVTVTPLLGTMLLKTPEKKDEIQDPYKGLFFVGYKKFLELCLKKRNVTLIVVGTIFAASIFGFGFVKQMFFPAATNPLFMVHYWLPQGTHIRKTEKDMMEIGKHIQEMDGVNNVSSFIGGGAMRFVLTYAPEEANSAYGMFLVGVEDYNKIDALMPAIEDYVRGNYPDAQIFARKFNLSPGEAQKIHARFRGPDHQVLRQLADGAVKIMHEDPYTADIVTDWRQKVPLIRPLVAEKQARNAGITRAEISNSLASVYKGRQIGLFRDRDELLPIVARGPANERNDAANLNYVQIWSPVAKKSVPLGQMVLGFESTSENSIIRRRHRLPTLTVKGDAARGFLATQAFESLRPKIESMFEERVKEKNLKGYSLEWGGEYEDSNDAQAAIAKNLPLPLLLMILTVICLFNNLKQPLIIWLTVPLALIGVTFGLLITNQPFGFMALLGFLSLSGMLIKNAIVLIDEINLQLREGVDPYQAVVMSGVSRLRPVSMAALTTVLGMIPLVADAFFVSMAVTIMFGLTFATILTLIIVPVFYVTFYKIPPPSHQ